ncbi:hypothetical protein BB560_005697 [Smittium megazygosporum]|uniref:Core domain-containing protein n=1 Tax=Smittium megazygosporum TaxID=133381 RepID=A0A2T9Z117_9FUNG|nr:hypothetical protein BB560_005697 [Smittium megazygosporum]
MNFPGKLLMISRQFTKQKHCLRPLYIKGQFSTLQSNYKSKAASAFTNQDYKLDDYFSSDKNQLILTPSAISRLKDISQSEGKTQYLRVLVESGGCYGFQYKMDLTSEPQPDDVILSKDGAKVVVDKLSLSLISGATVDWVDDLIGHSFKIVANPQSSGGCGCGASFDIKL